MRICLNISKDLFSQINHSEGKGAEPHWGWTNTACCYLTANSSPAVGPPFNFCKAPHCKTTLALAWPKYLQYIYLTRNSSPSWRSGWNPSSGRNSMVVASNRSSVVVTQFHSAAGQVVRKIKSCRTDWI